MRLLGRQGSCQIIANPFPGPMLPFPSLEFQGREGKAHRIYQNLREGTGRQEGQVPISPQKVRLEQLIKRIFTKEPTKNEARIAVHQQEHVDARNYS